MGSCGLLPPGFRFHPTDEELIVHYLRNQATSRPCPVSIIPELNIYKFDPWDLPAVDKAALGQEEWYFFTPRDRKYPNGARPNRATASGYWKATGTDKAIYSKSQYVGVKKALVFYKGRPPKGTKTDWIMHEYRLGGPSSTGSARPFMKANGSSSSSSSSSMRLDDWVLCRIYQKKHPKRAEEGEGYSLSAHIATTAAAPAQLDRVEHPPPRFPRSCSLAHLLEAAEYMPLSQMLNEYAADADDNFHTMTISFDGGSGAVDGDMYAPGTAKPTGSSNVLLNQQGFVVGPIFHY